MPLNYEQETSHIALHSILEDHAEWFHKVVQFLFYPEIDGASSGLGKPTSFARWIVDVNRSSEGVQAEMVEKISNLHSDLYSMSEKMIFQSRDSLEKPSYKDFQILLTLYEEFMITLRRLEKEALLERSGFDSFTGLKKKSLMKSDVERELHRLARDGRTFCLAIARIDHFFEMKKALPKTEMDGYLKLISGLVKLSIRSFDDAYYMGDNEFALCLKQSDVTGGISALERLRKELERQNIFISDIQKKLSMSCCIAEPVAGDLVDDLWRNLKKDLDQKDQCRTDTVLQYHELSPLQRYVKYADN